VRDRGTVRRESIRATAWSSNGLAKVQGDVDVGAGDVRGLTSIAGKLTAQSFRSRGSLEVVGAIEVAGDLSVDGTTHLQSVVHASTLTARGTLDSAADLRVDRALTATGTLEAPSAHVGLLDLTGSLELPKELEAVVSVRLRARGDSHVGEIRAKRVVVEGPPTALIPTLLRKVFGGNASVRVERIDADSVQLSAADVGFVHAKEIVLGAGAHVTALEGTVVRQHSTARVGPESRTPPPHGLSR
jgi:cytoskeletal protein CcmA (bactofilin family)